MDTSKIVGCLVVLYAGWSLLIGLVSNDMGGLASLGYNPDLTMSFGRAPLRFVIGIAIYGVLIYVGSRMISGKSKLRG